MLRILLVIKELFSNIFITFIVLLMIIVSVFASGALYIIGNNINLYIVNKFSSSIQPDVIKISPKPTASFGILNFLGKKPPGSVIDDAALRKIRNFPGVISVFPQMPSTIPISFSFSFFGMDYRYDFVCLGVPYVYIRDEIKNREALRMWVNWKPGDTIPCLIPDIFLDAYNTGFAKPNGIPEITPDIINGKSIQILFGKSSIKTLNGFDTANAVIVGFSQKINSIAIVIPIQALSYYNSKFNHSPTGNQYMNVFIQTSDHKSQLSVYRKLAAMGFVTQTDRALSQEILNLKNNAGLAVNVSGLIILLLAVISVIFSSIIASGTRANYFKILRILGASRTYISLMLFIKFALLGLAGSLIGLEILSRLPAAHAFNIAGFNLNFTVPVSFRNILILGSIIIPALSTIPSQIIVFSRNMGGD